MNLDANSFLCWTQIWERVLENPKNRKRTVLFRCHVNWANCKCWFCNSEILNMQISWVWGWCYWLSPFVRTVLHLCWNQSNVATPVHGDPVFLPLSSTFKPLGFFAVTLCLPRCQEPLHGHGLHAWGWPGQSDEQLWCTWKMGQVLLCWGCAGLGCHPLHGFCTQVGVDLSAGPGCHPLHGICPGGCYTVKSCQLLDWTWRAWRQRPPVASN